jgi:hypothetical protein
MQNEPSELETCLKEHWAELLPAIGLPISIFKSYKQKPSLVDEPEKTGFPYVMYQGASIVTIGLPILYCIFN